MNESTYLNKAFKEAASLPAVTKYFYKLAITFIIFDLTVTDEIQSVLKIGIISRPHMQSKNICFPKGAK